MSLIRNFALHLIIIQDNHFLKSSRLTAAIFVLLYNFESPLRSLIIKDFFMTKLNDSHNNRNDSLTTTWVTIKFMA